MSIPNTIDPKQLVEAEDQEVTKDQLLLVVNLSREQYSLEKKIEEKEAELAKLNEELNRNKTVTLPAAMQDANMEVCPLDGGYKIELRRVVHASIPSPNNKKEPNAAERNARGIAYMDEVAPDLVKTKLTIEFGRGEFKELKKFLSDNKRRKKPLEMELTRTVHTGTLEKWVKERDAAALETDEEAIQIKRVKVAELVAPKKPKAL